MHVQKSVETHNMHEDVCFHTMTFSYTSQSIYNVLTEASSSKHIKKMMIAETSSIFASSAEFHTMTCSYTSRSIYNILTEASSLAGKKSV